MHPNSAQKMWLLQCCATAPLQSHDLYFQHSFLAPVIRIMWGSRSSWGYARTNQNEIQIYCEKRTWMKGVWFWG